LQTAKRLNLAVITLRRSPTAGTFSRPHERLALGRQIVTLKGFSMTRSMEQNANVARFLPRMAVTSPDTVAVRAPKGHLKDGSICYRSCTFGELERASQAVGAALAARGITRGTRTLLLVRPGLDLIQICFALFKLGAIPIVIDPGMGLKSFLSCVRRSEPTAMVGIPVAILLSRVFRQAFASVSTRVCIGRTGAPALLGRSLEPVLSDPDELAAVLFTSGSTGAPKGVCYTHGMFDAQVRLIRDTYQIAPGEVDLPMLPIFALFNPALGMTTIVPEMNPSRPATVDPARIVRAIHQNQVTNSFGSPVLWTRIAAYCERNGHRLPSLRRVLLAGAPVPPDLLRRLQALTPNGEMHTPYGATECLPVSTISAREVLADTWGKTETGAGTCVGRPLGGVSAKIIESVDESISSWAQVNELSDGTIGEILVTGPSVTRTYDRLPEATARAKIIDPQGTVWHRMGDLGYRDAEGRLWFCGRMVERVETESGTLFTDQVEGIFNRHPQIVRSALIGLGQAPNQTAAVVVERAPGSSLTVADLRKIAASQPLTAGIETFFFHKKFPVDVRHNAKIHRLTLKRLFERS